LLQSFAFHKFSRRSYCNTGDTKEEKLLILLLLAIVAVSQLVLVGVRTDPGAAVEEMEALVDVHAAVERRWNTEDILILGSLNADCKYASGKARNRLTLRTDERFVWLIGDEVDTTTTDSDCTYDRCAIITHILLIGNSEFYFLYFFQQFLFSSILKSLSWLLSSISV